MVLMDRIIAMLISTVLVLIGLTVQQRAQQTSLGNTMLYVGKKQTLELADMLERDLLNVGYNIAPGQLAITSYAVQANGMLDSLIFWGVGRDSLGGAARQVEVRYRLVEADSVEISGESFQLYELQRHQREGATPWVLAGGSPETLTRLHIDPMGQSNTLVDPMTNPEEVRRIRVWLENSVMPESNMGKLMEGFRRLRWSVTLSPSNLRSFQGG